MTVHAPGQVSKTTHKLNLHSKGMERMGMVPEDPPRQHMQIGQTTVHGVDHLVISKGLCMK